MERIDARQVAVIIGLREDFMNGIDSFSGYLGWNGVRGE
jgi:hypothetical protein